MQYPSERAGRLSDIPREIRAIIFDGDGVVFDSETITNQAFCRIMKLHNVNISLEDVGPYLGINTKIMMQKIKEDFGVVIEPENYDRRCEQLYEAICRDQDGPQIIDGILPLLDWLDAKSIPFALATGASPVKMMFNLTRTNLLHRFRTKVTSSEVPNGKPAPDIYREAAHRLGVGVEESIVIEDTIAGLQGARAAGAAAIALAGTQTPEELKPEADLVFISLHELLKFLKERI